jgi:hypothetical protein
MRIKTDNSRETSNSAPPATTVTEANRDLPTAKDLLQAICQEARRFYYIRTL